MRATTQSFMTWLMSLNLITRYFVIAVLFHASLLVLLASIRLVINLPVTIPSVPPLIFGAGDILPNPFEEFGKPPRPEPILTPLPLTDDEHSAPSAMDGRTTGILNPQAQVNTSHLTPDVIGPTDQNGLSIARTITQPGRVDFAAIAGSSGIPSNPSVPIDQNDLLRNRLPANKVGNTRGPPNPLRATTDTERAVIAALRWLKANQKPDGSWDCHGGPEAGTALAALAYLGHGETVDSAEFGIVIQRGLEFLAAKVQPNGTVTGNMYAQALVTFALAEGYAMTGSPVLKPPLDRAARFIINAQKVQKENALHVGGWRYSASDVTSDLSVSGWQIMALKSAANAGVAVPAETFERALRFVWAMYGKPGFGYDAPSTAPGMTAVGCLCAQFLGHGDDERVTAALKWLREQKVEWDNLSGWAMYFIYYTSQAMFQGGPDYWPKWNDQMRNLLLNNQAPDGHWPVPPKSGEVQSMDKTPVYATSLGALMLETYYRYLPMYEVLRKKR